MKENTKILNQIENDDCNIVMVVGRGKNTIMNSLLQGV